MPNLFFTCPQIKENVYKFILNNLIPFTEFLSKNMDHRKQVDVTDTGIQPGI